MGAWVLPIKGKYTLTARYGQAGPRWASGYHTGQDFAADKGTPVYAVADGTTTFRGVKRPYGNTIIIKHDDGTESWYCHLNTMTLAFPGFPVKVGQSIGTVGETGNTTGPHLHLEARKNGKHFDPMTMFSGAGPPDVTNPPPTTGTEGLGDASTLTAPETWQRVGLFVGGGVLLIVAFLLLSKSRNRGLL